MDDDTGTAFAMNIWLQFLSQGKMNQINEFPIHFNVENEIVGRKKREKGGLVSIKY